MKDEIEISPFGNNLIYKDGYTKDFIISVINRKNLAGIKINTRWENVKSLDFLTEFNFLKSLDIVGNGDFDFNFLSGLKNLRRLSISLVGEKKIDLSNQINLENLSIHWRKGKIFGLEKCQKINSLVLVEYNAEDFHPINSLTKLKSLEVKTSTINTINGIENFLLLENLLLGNCKRLNSIKSIEILKNLKSINFDICPIVRDYRPLGHLSNIESIQIINCKGVNTIKFVQNLHSLKKLVLLGNTDILDGDMLPAKEIKEVIYKHRQHYNYKIENKKYDDLVKRNLKKNKSMFKK